MDRGTTALPGAIQAPEDLEAWEEFLGRERPRGVVELGTARGGFAKWLNERVEWLRTIDIRDPDPGTPGFVRIDVWHELQEVRDLIAEAPHAFVLYCDNGSKRFEVETYAPSLEVGDFLAVHDLGTEIDESDIPAGFERVLVFGLTGFYRKVA